MLDDILDTDARSWSFAKSWKCQPLECLNVRAVKQKETRAREVAGGLRARFYGVFIATFPVWAYQEKNCSSLEAYRGGPCE